MSDPHWIEKAMAGVRSQGGLHRSLGVAQGKTISAKKISAAARRGGKVGKQARMARTMGRMR